MRFKLFIAFIVLSFNVMTQTIFYQNVLHGGVTGNGGSTWFGAGTFNFSLLIPTGSSIEKAYLIAARDSIASDTFTVVLNSQHYTFSNSTIVTQGFISGNDGGSYYYPQSSIHALDITNAINPAVSNYSLTIAPQYPPFGGVYSFFYLYVVYENPLLPIVCTNIFLNTQDVAPITNYHLSYLNPIKNTYPVGLEVMTSYFCDTVEDGSYVKANNNQIGLLGGSDSTCNSWACTSPYPNFSYYNNTLFGLDDDNSNAFMEGTDATADIKSYINNNDTNIDLVFTYQSNFEPFTNPIRAVSLNYVTPCDTFSVNLLTEDTTICKGASVQLGAVSVNPNAKYEWLPQKDLSCYNCANPVFTGDSSQVYTVRIWNTDSCSKVLPVRVNVLPQPKFTSVVTTPTTCGSSTGSLTAVSTSSTGSLAGADSLFSNGVYVGKTPQTLTNLSAGNYTLYLIDTNSCKSKDTMVTTNSVNLPDAPFTLNPTTGAVPLSVSSDNQSTHATDYSWYFQHDSTTITSPSFEFDTSGTYTITLIAYNNTPDCSDTFSLQIVVYDSLQLIIPNVFTPNGDNQNDVFSIQVNAPCTGTIVITNRWGNEMLSKNIATDSKQKLFIWDSMTDGQKASDGVYFYSLSLRDNKNKEYHFQGFVELVR